MRVECESCRELVVASFAINGEAVQVTCSACHAVMIATAATEVAADTPMCPKCAAKLTGDGKACPACGLGVDKMASYAEARDAVVPDVVRDAWLAATEKWDDEARHDALIRLVATNNCYAWAAGRYRTRSGDRVAQRQIDRLRRAAEATLFASATVRADATPKPYRATTAVLAMLIVALAAGLLYAMVIRDQAEAPGAPVPAKPLVRGQQPVSPSTIK